MGTLILCYHRINEGVEDPFHLCVSPHHFADHLELLGRKATFVTLDEAIQPSDHSRVAVTLDDGYADNVLHAAPIARRLDVPITVYVTSGMVGDRRGFWWDRLAYLIRHGSDHEVKVEVEVGSGVLTFSVGSRAQAARVIDDMRKRLLHCSEDEIEQVLASVADSLGVPPPASVDARLLTADELMQLGSFDNVTIGAHTTRHVRLRGQPFDAQLEMVSRSKQELECTLGAGVDHFAYPFGGADSFDETSVSAVRQAGFTTATTTMPGSVAASPDPLVLPRRLVMDWPAWRFRAQMAYWGLL